jgi:hypothetical protein
VLLCGAAGSEALAATGSPDSIRLKRDQKPLWVANAAAAAAASGAGEMDAGAEVAGMSGATAAGS